MKNSAGEPSCICDNGYHGPDCSIEEGLSGVTIAVVVCSVTVFLAVVMLVFAFLFRK